MIVFRFWFLLCVSVSTALILPIELHAQTQLHPYKKHVVHPGAVKPPPPRAPKHIPHLRSADRNLRQRRRSVAISQIYPLMAASAPMPASRPPVPRNKDQYNIFNPTPEAQLRKFTPDRPNKSFNPFTVDAGHFQYETDLLGAYSDNYTAAHTDSRQLFTADPTLKLGLTNNVDLALVLGGFQDLRTKQRNGAASTVYAGYGDTVIRLKANVWGNDGGDTAFALMPYIKLPTASRGLGNNQVEGGVIAPLQVKLPYGFTSVITSEVGEVKNPADSGSHVSVINVVNLSHPITENLTASAEFYSRVQTANNPTIYTADFALAYLLGPNTQVDSAIYAGLNKQAPDLIGYMAVIFDVDGTLVNSVDLHAQAWVDAFQEFGHQISFGAVREQIGKGGDQLLPVFLSQDQLADYGEALNQRRGEILKERYLSQIKPFDDVRALFERIRGAGLRIVLASSAKADELQTYKKIAQIEELTDAETSSDDAARSKPEPDIFQAALRKLGDISPDHIIVVGDTPYDAQAAAKAGLRTVGVLCGGFAEHALREAGCIAIYRNPADLLVQFDRTPLCPESARSHRQ
jgi:HAD superfamily hydrolase (TIGR01549 family)